MAYINNSGQVRIGVRGWVPVFGPEDPGTPNTIDQDSTNFILASGISDSVQTSAIETLVADLKAYGLWTKMKAVYPFVGGSAASHKFNLKDPRDLDAAYRLAFNGGWVHSSNGAKPNGTNGYANTYLVPNSVFNVTDLVAVGYYSRTAVVNATRDYVLGAYTVGRGSLSIVIKRSNDNFYTTSGADFPSGTTYRQVELSPNPYTGDGLYHFSQQGTSFKYWRNTTLIGQNGVVSSNLQQSTHPIFLGTYNNNGTPATDWTDKEAAFSYFSTKLTDSEAINLYTTIQKFQTTLGRHVGTPYVSDPDAITFLMAAGITDGTQAAAINTLVIRMKADGVWTKMKAIYPFVGGNATSHKFNLKDPRDLDAAFRLVFNGGWTHTGTGALPNGTTGYANTFFTPSSNFISNENAHISVYQSQPMTLSDMGGSFNSTSRTLFGANTTFIDCRLNSNETPVYVLSYNSDGKGLFMTTKNGSAQVRAYRNNNLVGTVMTQNSSNPLNMFISARNGNGTPNEYESTIQKFISFGDGLTDTEATALYNSIQSYQTTLGRQVNVPIVSDTDAQSFLNAANITSFQQASAVNKLVIDLKAAGVWSKMKAIYPFIGGSATSHKFNLKDPRDLDAAYRLVFNGGWTHTGTGALPNGTTGYADTKLSPISALTISNHFSFYNNGTISNTQTTIDIGSGNGDPNAGELYLWTYREDGTMKYDNGSSVTNRVSASTTSKGFSLGTRTSNTSQKIYKNGNLLATNTNVNVNSLPYPNIYIGGGNINGTSQYPSNKQSSFVSMGDGLTDAEATSLYTAVQTYQTALGRSVDTPAYNNGLVINLDAGNANSYPGTGTTWFDLASGNNGTLVNGPTYDTTNGGSLYFDGTNKYTDISYTKINITNKLTISSWVYFLSQPSTTGNPNIVDKWDWPNNKRSFHIGTENGYLATSISYDGLFDNRIVCSDNSSIVLNQWINITMTYDGRTLKLYKNGSLIQSSSFSQDRNIFSDITTNIFLGRSRGTEGSSRHLNARISGVQIYSNSLTATEILNNFNSTRGRFGL